MADDRQNVVQLGERQAKDALAYLDTDPDGHTDVLLFNLDAAWAWR